MANQYLHPILEQLFGETFIHDYAFEDRMRMSQAAIYLLKVTGFPFEEYSYRWVTEDGPASRKLTQDLLWGQEIFPMKKIKFRKEYQDCIDQLRVVVNATERGEYSIRKWLQCISAIHYLRTYVMKWNAPIEEVVSEVERRMPTMSTHDINMKAAQWLDGLLMAPELFAAWWPSLQQTAAT